jgi:AraC-like DNA-binding protein
MLGAGRGQIWRYAPEYRRPRHFHSEPELNLVVAGSGTFGTGNTVFEVRAGDLLCWPPGQDHELIVASPDFDLFVAGLTAELSSRVLGAENTASLAAPAHVRLTPAASLRFRSLCEIPLPGLEPSAVEAHVATFWREAHRLRLGTPDRHPLGRRVLMSLLERADLGRARVAHRARGYPSEVSRQFRAHTGLTFSGYRSQLRLLAFVRSVDAGSTLLAAALNAGFGSYSQCHRTFWRAFGCSPRRFFSSELLRSDMRDAFSPSGSRACGALQSGQRLLTAGVNQRSTDETDEHRRCDASSCSRHGVPRRIEDGLPSQHHQAAQQDATADERDPTPA